MPETKVGAIKIVPSIGKLKGVLSAPHIIPAEAKVGTTATFGVGVKTVPATDQSYIAYTPIRVYASVRIMHTSGVPAYEGKSPASGLLTNQTVRLNVPVSIPAAAKTGDYNVFAEVFTAT